jgi:dipeptide/tripeptide permease
MTDEFLVEQKKLSWRFPEAFWAANLIELFERAAFYGMFIALSYYLTQEIGFSDIQAGWVAAPFSACLYFLPTIFGAVADQLGFRRSLMLAFSLLTLGYTGLGCASFLATDTVPCKLAAIGSLVVIVLGGGFIKPVISGTVAKCSDETNRARAFSIFYSMVNLGSFAGKTCAAPLRIEWGLEYINFYSAAMALVALVLVLSLYHDVDRRTVAKRPGEVLRGLLVVLTNIRFLTLILIVGGFWVIQTQLYSSLPKYVIRLLGDTAKPEWLANINPAVVVLLVVPITHLVRKVKPVNSILVALFIVSTAAFMISLSPQVREAYGNSINLAWGYTIHPVTLMVAIGIGMIGLAECFLSPKFLEYASKQAPKGEEGLYLGYSYLTSFFSWGVSFLMSGYLLESFCPDPEKLSKEAHAQWQASIASGGELPLPAEYAHAHYLWYVIFGVGAAAFVALLIYRYNTESNDRKRSNENGAPSNG